MSSKILLFCCATMILFSCGSTKKIDFSTDDGPKIWFGWGGGFSGLEHRYCLTEEGSVYKFTIGNDKGEYHGRLSEGIVDQLFLNTQQIIDTTETFNRSGNMYEFFEYEYKNTKNSYLWSNSRSPSQEITTLYHILKKYNNELDSTSKE